MALIFFDQNVMEKMSKKGHQAFQNNVDLLLKERAKNNDLILTPFSLLEFSSCNQKDISDIRYRGVKFTEFPFSSYKNFSNQSMAKYLKDEIYKKVTKDFLKEKLEDKKIREKNHLNNKGFNFIDLYTEKIDLLYEDLINLLYLEQLSQINTSKFSTKDRDKYIDLCLEIVIDYAFKKHSLGGFRTVLRLHKEWGKQPIPQKIKEDPELSKRKKTILNIVEQSKLKSKGDRLDCDIIHLAFFGGKDKPCHIYTTDDKNLITHRLNSYFVFMELIINYYFEHFQLKKNRKTFSENYEPPEWNCGKVFILNRETGEKIKKIPVKKIYEKKLSLLKTQI